MRRHGQAAGVVGRVLGQPVALTALVIAVSCSGDSPTAPQFGPAAAVLIDGGQDQSAVVGQQLPVALTARVVDANGRPVRGQVVNFRVVSGGGSFFAGVATTSDSGIARERWTLGTSVADSQRVEARAVDAAGNPLVFGVFRATAIPDVPASVVKVGGDGQAVVAGTPVADSLAARVVDRFGNPVPAVLVRWAVTSGGGTLTSDSTLTGAQGIARVRWTVGSQVGSVQRVVASVGTLAPMTFTATVQPAAAAAVQLVTPAAGAASGAPFATAPRVSLLDSFGNRATGNNSVVTLTASVGATVLGTATINAVAGEATFAGAGVSGLVGDYTLTYGASGLVVATQTIALGPGTPAALVVTTQPAGAVSGSAFLSQPVVEIRDAAGNRTPSTAMVTANVASGGGSLIGATSVAAVAGVATFTDIQIDRAGSHTLRFTVAAPALTVTADTLAVAPGAAAQLAIVTGADGASSGLAFTTQPIVEIRDAAGNRTPSTADVTASASGGATLVGTAMLPAQWGAAGFSGLGLVGPVGTYTLTFSAAGLTSATQSVALAAGMPAQLAIVTPAANAGSGTAFGAQPVAEVRDGAGNRVTLSTAAVTLTASVGASVLGTATVNAVAGVATFTEVGLAGSVGVYTLTYSAAGLTAATQAIAVVGVQEVAAGSSHTLVLKSDSTLWAAGSNDSGQLGDGTTTRRLRTVQVMTQVKAVAAGVTFTMILRRDGTLWATGYNGWGQLGDGTITSSSTPIQVMTGVQAVAAGGSHTLILKVDGTVWAAGLNYDGQLGDGTTTLNRSTPVQVMTGVKTASAGRDHTMLLKSDSTLWATGANGFGQLGVGGGGQRSTPVQVMTGVQAVAAGGDFTMMLKSDGTLWATGNNQFGQLGDGTTVNRSTPVQVMTGVKAVSAGRGAHAMVLKTDGTLWATGYNGYGQFGDGTTAVRITTPVQVMSGVQSVAAGAAHTIVLTNDGAVWTTGGNWSGQLGDGTTINRLNFVKIIP